MTGQNYPRKSVESKRKRGKRFLILQRQFQESLIKIRSLELKLFTFKYKDLLLKKFTFNFSSDSSLAPLTVRKSFRI